MASKNAFESGKTQEVAGSLTAPGRGSCTSLEKILRDSSTTALCLLERQVTR